MKVALVGDWHGNDRWAISVLDRLASEGVTTVYQLGDFGLWPGFEGENYLQNIVTACEGLGITLWITPGNHEDYSQIEDPENFDGEVPPLQVLAEGPGFQVAILPRGYSWEIGGKKFLSFGGAPSIDFQFRKPGRSWWAEEMIRDSDIMRLEDRGEIDVMLAHDSPDGGTAAVQKIIDTPSHLSGWSDKALEYAREGRIKMNQAVELVDPRVFAHGHYHVKDSRGDADQERLYLSLDMDGLPGNVGILDLEEMKFTWI